MSELEETRRRLEEALWYLGRIRPLPEAAVPPGAADGLGRGLEAALPSHPRSGSG